MSDAREPSSGTDNEPSLKATATRGAIGGVLMGLANLVPGISGGTMLLAAGVYPQFIQAIAEVSTLTFRKRSLLVLACVLAAAFAAIISLAGPVRDLVVHHRWMAYSGFIGLTLGGVPIVWQLIGRRTISVWLAAAVGMLGMAAVAWFQAQPTTSCGDGGGFVLMLLAGLAGASAMILPGISGGYLLLVMGVYVAILSGIADVKLALKSADLQALMGPMVEIVIPVGIGAVVGIVVVSNLLKWLLARAEKPTLGVLLGLLVGAVFGLWPFQRGVAPAIGEQFKCMPVTAQSLATIKPEAYPTQFFGPTALEVGASIALIVAGLATTMVIARFGARKP